VGEIGRRFQLLEVRPGSTKLELCRLGVAQRPARHSEEHTHASGGIRHRELLPHRQRATQMDERGLTVAAGQLDGASGVRGEGVHDRGAEVLRELLQLGTRGAASSTAAAASMISM